MRRLFSTRHGFFALAALVSWALLLVIDPEFRWVSGGLGCLYLVLSILFWGEDLNRPRIKPRTARMPDDADASYPMPPPPPP
jgi:hypothetical protein